MEKYQVTFGLIQKLKIKKNDIKTDTTKNFSGKILSKGNILASLIMENINK